jgi:RNA polymerase sigma-70 factor (sigma-E family)
VEGGIVKPVIEEDFEAYLRARGQALRRFAYLLTLHPQDAEDLLQTVLASVAGRWPRVRESEDVDAYIRRALVNKSITARRRRLRRPEQLVATHSDRPTSESGPTLETKMLLGEALRALPPRQRAVIVLRYYLDMTEAEAATTLGCSVGTVKSQASKALKHLRQSQLSPTHERLDNP